MKYNTALLILAVSVGLASAVCPSGYLEFQEASCMPAICLRFAQEKKSTWYVWKTLCEAENATLAKLTGNLHGQVYQYIMDHPDMQDEAYWVGASDVMTEGE
ncbi:hypothetical protein SK128_003186 [Halocaridina rubra]|uniref:C-type lectin n=1 Tax=Halocaridina rubra TaxID=373956 RepID=A0AAN8WE02_HALRR